MSKFKLTKPVNVDEFVGDMYIYFKVEGFWSMDQVTLHVQYDRKDTITCSVNHSSGGEESDYGYLKAAKNFGECILAAVKMGEEIEANPEPWIEAYKANMKALRTEYEAVMKAEIERERNDTKVTQEEAMNVVGQMYAGCKHRGEDASKEFRLRGSDYTGTIDVRQTYGGKVQFNLNGRVIARKSLVNHLTRRAAEFVGA